MKASPKDRDTTMHQCNVHLAYLGQGMFVTLKEWDVSLSVLPSTGDSKPVILGSLSAMEDLTVNKSTLAGLGVGLSKPKSKLNHPVPLYQTLHRQYQK